ncbi:hypothetical protein SD70_31140 [Gordoniibacillus kamchatkensis]|uniref:Uncharacterized protein n=1 Tax=Gordoniibacillus kamchatkensis TaxID=1590651 RepID=A0ABR5A9J1_9BACL|nr:hypothetical protein SD70_31140 [Paenibacillus sp. VKM B-2647]
MDLKGTQRRLAPWDSPKTNFVRCTRIIRALHGFFLNFAQKGVMGVAISGYKVVVGKMTARG